MRDLWDVLKRNLGDLNGPELKFYFLSQIPSLFFLAARVFSIEIVKLQIFSWMGVCVGVVCIFFVFGLVLNLTGKHQDYQQFMSQFNTQKSLLLSKTSLLKVWRTAFLLVFFPSLTFFASSKDLIVKSDAFTIKLLFYISFWGLLSTILGFSFFHFKLLSVYKKLAQAKFDYN